MRRSSIAREREAEARRKFRESEDRKRKRSFQKQSRRFGALLVMVVGIAVVLLIASADPNMELQLWDTGRGDDMEQVKATWLYRRTETNLWTVGFYTPQGDWVPESDHNSPEEAAARVHYLNGGNVR